MAKRKKKAKKKSTVKTKNWLVSSNEYAEFAKICEDNHWEERADLPAAGTKDEKDSGLDEFIKRGLAANDSSDGKPKPFTRDQINRKFEHWKNSNKTEKELRRVDEAKVDSAESILQRLKKADTWKSSTTRSRLVLHDKTTKTHAEIFEPHLLTVLIDFRANVITFFNELLFDDKAKKKKDRYTEFETETLIVFAKQLLSSAGDFCASLVGERKKKEAKCRAYSAAYVIMKAFIDELVCAVKRGGASGNMESNALDALKEFEAKPQSKILADNLVNKTIYNIGGWLSSAIVKEAARRKEGTSLRNVLFRIDKNANVTKDFAQRTGLPTGKVDTMITSKDDALSYVSYEFYFLTSMLESVCERILVERSIKIFGSQVACELGSFLEENETLFEAVRALTQDSSDEEVKEAVRYVVQTYMNMRSLDFVRQIMGMSRRSLAQGTRPTLAVLSATGNAGSGKSVAKKKGDICCFFCSEQGHAASTCVAIDVVPAEGEPTTRQVRVDIKGQNKTIVWHFCNSCRGWRHHSTAEHDGTLEESAEKLNAVQTVLEIMDASEAEDY